MLDFVLWDQWLRRYVNDWGQVNYSAWQQESVQPLQDWLERLSSLNPTNYSLDEQLALWLNLYNALVIARILDRYPIASIRPTLLGVPNWVAFLWFFWRPAYQLHGDQYSLNRIEHGTLRPQFKEPRIHFALVCAAIGCPLLRPEAYVPEQVRTQLEDDARRFVQNPDKVRYDSSTATLYCSQILKWYRQDFLAVAPSLPDYLQSYLPEVSLNAATPVQYLPYDWRLNQRTSS